MQTAAQRSAQARTSITLLIALFCLVPISGCDPSDPPQEPVGILELTVRDAATGEIIAARVELLDDSGGAIVPDDALAIFSDCGNVPAHTWIPGFAILQTAWSAHKDVHNPYTGTTQFYTDGSLTARLAAGTYSVRVTRGNEYKRYTGTIEVDDGGLSRVELRLERWIDLASEGWYAADDHLHIQRPSPRFDARLATWMEAEGLQVANLLQMGLARDVHLTPQYAFGARSVYKRGDTFILSGQENPRTHVLGHAIILGAREFIDFPTDYLLYDRVWEQAHRQGGVNGYAHWALGGAEEGLALWGHESLLDFVEVLNLGFPFYDRWYEALNLGIQIGPTAGTDYPCLPGLPGRERFYARPDGPLNEETWLEAVRQGKTFVTNGPAIELVVEDTLPGGELLLEEPGKIRVSGLVRFDPERDAVGALELIRDGVVVASADGPGSAGVLRLETALEVNRTTWVALRASGVKQGETPIFPRSFFSSMMMLERDSTEDILSGLPEGPVTRPSTAHTAAVLITVAGTPSLDQQPRGQTVARIWLTRLDKLESRLTEEQMRLWSQFPGRGDGVDLRTSQANRPALLKAIEAARHHYAQSSRQPSTKLSAYPTE